MFGKKQYFENKKYGRIVDLIYALQKEYEFYILDLYHDEGMLAVSKEDYQQYMNDPVHPTLKGYKEWWTPRFIDFFEKLP